MARTGGRRGSGQRQGLLRVTARARVCARHTEDMLATCFLKVRQRERFVGNRRTWAPRARLSLPAAPTTCLSSLPWSPHCGSTSSAPGTPRFCHMPSRLIAVPTPVSPRATIERSGSSTNEDNWVFADCQSCSGGAQGGWAGVGFGSPTVPWPFRTSSSQHKAEGSMPATPSSFKTHLPSSEIGSWDPRCGAGRAAHVRRFFREQKPPENKLGCSFPRQPPPGAGPGGGGTCFLPQGNRGPPPPRPSQRLPVGKKHPGAFQGRQ